MFGLLTAIPAPQQGQPAIYKTYEELFADLSTRMQHDGYKVVKARSHRGKIGGSEVPGNEMVRCDLVCDRGGRPYKCLATKHKTSTKKTDCPWKAKAVNRKMVGGWVLTVLCDQHNHEAGTPEPVGLEEREEDAEGEVVEGGEGTPTGPAPDPETQAALAVAGVSQTVLRLTGDTFHGFKTEYRKMSKPDRLSILSQFQLRVAAIYAVENEDMQRQVRAEQQERRHRQIEENRRGQLGEKRRRPAGDVVGAQGIAQAVVASGSGNGSGTGSGSGTASASPAAGRRRTAQSNTPQGQNQNQNQGSGQVTPQQGQQQIQQPPVLQNQQMQTPMMGQPGQQGSVDPNSFLHLNQFQVQVPPGGVGSPPVGQFHHYGGPPRRLRGSRQASS